MCDTLCVRGANGMLFAKNSDRAVGEVQVVEAHGNRRGAPRLHTQYLVLPDPTGAAAVIGSRPTWLWGFEHGVNEHRVAIGNERVWTAADDRAATPALLGMDLVRLGLERATTAGAAVDVIVDLLERHGQGGIAELSSGDAYFSSFLVADPTEAWVLETCDRTWAARPLGTGGSISNRLSLTDDWTRASADLTPGDDFQHFLHPTFPTGHADRRLAATAAGIARHLEPHHDRHDPGRRAADQGPSEPDGPVGPVGPVGPPDSGIARDLVATLRHHGGHAWGVVGDPASRQPAAIDPLPPTRIRADGTGVSVCMHLREWEVTAASLVAELPVDPEHPVRLWATLGSPCVGVYVPCFPDVRDPTTGAGLVPGALSDPRTWARIDQLRRRVEAAHDRDPRVDAGIDATDGDARGVAELAAIRATLGPLEDALWDEADALLAAAPGPRPRSEAERGPFVAFAASVAPRLDAALSSLGA